jgi:tetratricopeptide (TPR) repeat protein
MQKKVIIFGVISVVLLGIIYASSASTSSQVISQSPTQVVSTTGPEAKEIEKLGLEEFNPINDIKKSTISADDTKMYTEISDAIKIGGDLTDKTKVKAALDALNPLISKYPEYADPYLMRVIFSLILGDSNYDSLSADLESALKYRQSQTYPSSFDSDAPIYLLKAKVDALSGNNDAELNDFQRAVELDPSSDFKSDFFQTGATKPGENSNLSAPTLSDFNRLVQLYPNDYRTYLFRGLFYASFTNFDEQYYTQAFNDFQQALNLNPHSAEVNYLLGQLYVQTTYLTKKAAGDVSDITGQGGGFRDQQKTIALRYFNESIASDSAYKYAYAGAAEVNLDLKNYADAIQDYSTENTLHPNNAAAYNDKALTEIAIDQFSQGIVDLKKALEIRDANPKYGPNGIMGYDTYQNLGDAYVKAGDFASATSSYSRAIGIKFASQVFLMNVDKIRAIYPEFQNISDQDLLEGLRQKYFPDMTSTNFNSQIVNNKGFNDFILSDLYVARGDAYKKADDGYNAAKEYARAMHNDPTYILNQDQQSIYENPNFTAYQH